MQLAICPLCDSDFGTEDVFCENCGYDIERTSPDKK